MTLSRPEAARHSRLGAGVGETDSLGAGNDPADRFGQLHVILRVEAAEDSQFPDSIEDVLETFGCVAEQCGSVAHGHVEEFAALDVGEPGPFRMNGIDGFLPGTVPARAGADAAGDRLRTTGEQFLRRDGVSHFVSCAAEPTKCKRDLHKSALICPEYGKSPGGRFFRAGLCVLIVSGLFETQGGGPAASAEPTTGAELTARTVVRHHQEGMSYMLHYSCDLCGQRIGERRFVARLEVFPSFDPEQITDEDLDRDNLEEISEILAEMELTGNLELDDVEPRTYRYDLCPTCYREFRKDPLARHRPRRMRFSEN